jgi:hypothetical protein
MNFEAMLAFAPEPEQPVAQRSISGWRVGKWVIVAVVVFVILAVPVFPRDTIVYADGTTQMVTNQVQYSTVFQVYTTTTASQISVFTGGYQYLSDYYSNYYYGYCSYCCYTYNQQTICNYAYWPWFAPSYATTVTITLQQRVVGVTRTQEPGGLETLTLTYYNGQSTTVQNVYNDHLTQIGTTSIESSMVATNTITDTITTPVTQMVPCHKCILEHVTQHVSILQLLFGY